LGITLIYFNIDFKHVNNYKNMILPCFNHTPTSKVPCLSSANM